MKIEPPRHLLIGGMEMSIGKSEPLKYLKYNHWLGDLPPK